MEAAALVTFREVLEIALIITIVLAATDGVPGRGKWLALGLLGGLFGSVLVALSADAIASSMEGMGQELFNGGILSLAVLMIGWTVVWMQKHGRELAARFRALGREVSNGEKPLYAIAILVSLAMWREGSEIALFMYSVMATSEESLASILTGAVGGAVGASVIGYLIYAGLIRIPVKHFFRVTGWLLILLACGIAGQAAGFFIAAGVLPELSAQVWDSSHLLSQGTLPGQVMHALFGYTERPTGMQLAVYGATFAVLFILTRLVNRQPKPLPAMA